MPIKCVLLSVKKDQLLLVIKAIMISSTALITARMTSSLTLFMATSFGVKAINWLQIEALHSYYLTLTFIVQWGKTIIIYRSGKFSNDEVK